MPETTGSLTATSGQAPQGLLVLLAVAAGLVVANNYYNQPLLHEIGASFGASDSEAAMVSTLTQAGYACGLLLLLPLGDLLERRKLILFMLAMSMLALVTFAGAATLPIAIAVAFAIGFSSIVPQLLPPVASQLAAPGKAGQAVGLVMGGLLLGIALSRFAGGVLGDFLGWRGVYWIAAGLMVVLFAALYRTLPVLAPTYAGSYRSLLLSLGGLVRRHAELNWLTLVAALQFAAFSLIWTTFAFHLRSMPGNYPASIVGLFALIGSGGVIAALTAGRLTDSMPPRLLLVAAAVCMLAAFAFFAQALTTLVWLVPAVMLLDLGMQVSHVTSMARILRLDASARSRLNTVYMATRFAGGAAGTVIGSVAWTHGGWNGVCTAGAALCLVATVIACIMPLRTTLEAG
ncbi:MFS transporter [Mesorhizobium sp. CAU 1741]|uniref:MFS transporter n=1 Tax=Mesorhizobium sp. CAU 1741 TaxID=3140366 RepID=UPI00325A6772